MFDKLIQWVIQHFIKKKLFLKTDLKIILKPLNSSKSGVIGVTDYGQEKGNEKPIQNIETMTKGEEIVALAMKEIGTSEFPDNSNNVKYNTWFYGKEVSGPNYPWCGVFDSYIYAHAGYPLGNIGYLKGFALVQAAVDHYTKTGEMTLNPVAGDLVFYDFTGEGTYHHTGIYSESTAENYFKDIEGNTSVANQSNGGTVMLRTRQKHNVLFAHPSVLE